MNGLWAFVIVLTSLGFLAGGWLGWQLLRQNGRILLRLDELEKRLNELEFGEHEEPAGFSLGAEAPAFELPDLAGRRQSLAQFHSQPVLLIFFNPDCGYCRELVPKLAALVTERERSASAALTHPIETTRPVKGSMFSEALRTETVRAHAVLLLTTGDVEKNRQFFTEHKVGCPVLLQSDGEVANAYQVNGTPAGYLVSANGRIASELAIGAEALLKLASQPVPELLLTPLAGAGENTTNGSDGRANRFNQRSFEHSKINRDGLKAGTPAPDFRLPRLDGHGELALTDLRGKRVLLVFSSPGCDPCNTVAPQLEQCHREHPELGIVMISKGEPKETRAKVKEHGLSFPVVLQQQWEISRRYAMFATPVAYLIDEAGIISHDVAVGAEPIRDLMTRADLAPEFAPAC